MVSGFQNYLCFCAAVYDTQNGQGNITMLTGFVVTNLWRENIHGIVMRFGPGMKSQNLNDLCACDRTV